MVKVDRFDIIYNAPNDTFRSGEELRGVIAVEIGQAVDFDALSLRLKGRAQTQWSTHSGKTSTAYLGEESYFDFEPQLALWEHFTEDQIPAGYHQLPFCIRLPDPIPSSFEGACGHVRYFATATLKRSKLQFDLHCRRAFTVVGNEDLNELPAAAEPVELVEEQAVLCCFAHQGSVDVSIRIDRRGFVAADKIAVEGLITNKSRKSIDTFTMRLKQYITYMGNTTFAGFEGRHEDSKEIYRTDVPLDCEPGKEVELSDVSLELPVRLAPSMAACRLLDIKYGLKIDIGSYIRVEVPLIIGTVPLRVGGEADDGGTSPPPPMAEQEGCDHISLTTPSPGAPLGTEATSASLD